MKMFSKMLALFLALVTLLAMVPISAIAEPWFKVDADNSGELPVVSVTVDASALIAILGDAAGPDADTAILPAVKNGIHVDMEALLTVLTAKEIFEIIPKDDVLKIVGEDEIHQMILEKPEFAEYIDPAVIFNALGEDRVMEIVSNVNGLYKVIDLASLGFSGDLTTITLVHLYLSGKSKDEILAAVQYDALAAEVDMKALIAEVSADVLLAELDDHELLEIVRALPLKEHLVELAALLVRKTLSNVDEITLNGTQVASKDENQLLEIHAGALVKVINEIRPSLDDIATTEDGVILSTGLSFKYTAEETDVQKEKEMTVQIVLGGDISSIQKLVKRVSNALDRYVDVSYRNGTLSADVTLPAKAAKAFQKLLDTDHLDAATKEKLLSLADMDGQTLVSILDQLTPTDVVNLLESIDPEALFNAAMQYSYVEKCVAYASQITGVDMSDLTLDQLLDYTDKIPGIDTIAGAIKERYGVDVLAVLENYSSANDLYQAALNKAEERVDLFNKATTKLVTLIQTYVPTSAMDLTLMDGYNGNGNFTLNKTLRFNAKSLVTKGVNYVTDLLGISFNTEILDMMFSQISEGTQSIRLDLSLQLTDIYSITYKDRETGKILFRTFLPVGADLTAFRHSVNGTPVTQWYDANGNVVAAMPAADTVVYTKAEGGDVPGPDDPVEITITFVNQQGELLGTITTLSGNTLRAFSAQVKAFADQVELPEDVTANAEHVYDGFQVCWHYYNVETGVPSTGRVYPSVTRFTKDTTLIADAMPNYYLYIEDVDYDVTLTRDGNNFDFDLEINEDLPDGFSLDMDHSNLLTLANGGKNVSLTLRAKVGDDVINFMVMDDATLADFHTRAQSKLELIYAPQESAPEDLKESAYAGNDTASFFDFSILVDGVASHVPFAGDMIITLPYDNALSYSAGSDDVATRVHVFNENGEREYLERLNVESDKYVTFKAPHFSSFVIANEYKLDVTYLSNFQGDTNVITGSLDGYNANDLYFPEGYTVAISPLPRENYTWVSSSYQYEGKDATDLAFGASFVMPAKKVSLAVTLQPDTYFVYYYMGATKLYTHEYVFNDTSVTLGHTNEQAIKDAHPAGYTDQYTWVGFDSTQIGISNMYVFVKWNAIPYTVEFKANGQVVASITYTADTYQTVVAPAIPTVDGQYGTWGTYDLTSVFGKTNTTLVVEASYSASAFAIKTDGKVSAAATAKPGEAVSVTVTEKEGYEAIVTVTLADGSTLTVEDGKFLMPAGDVYVSVAYQAKKLNYTVNGVAGTPVEMGSTVTFQIPLALGQTLKSVTDGCVLISVEVENGAMVLTYGFTVAKDGMAVTYETIDNGYNIIKIFNGNKHDAAEDPNASHDSALFAKWSATVAGFLQFASFAPAEGGESGFDWMWLVVIALLVLIVIAVVILLLTIRKKKGGEPTEEPAEEATEEEATEEAPAEETTEETTEEAPAEEATEETTEEAPAEEATEETTEEAPAEEATEEATADEDDTKRQ